MIIKNKKAGKRSGSSTGTPGAGALMVVFAVLCLTVFSILALPFSLDAVMPHYL